MKPKRKLIQVFPLLLSGVSLVSILLIGALWISFEADRSVEESAGLRADYIAVREATINLETNRICDYIEAQRQSGRIKFMKDIRDQVYEAVAFLEAVRAADDLPLGEERAHVLSALSAMTFNQGRGRYFISTVEGRELLESDDYHYENLDIRPWEAQPDYQSPGAFAEIVNSLSRVKEGFFRYNLIQGPRNQTGEDDPQVAYLKIFEPFQWIMGASAYSSDYTRQLQTEMIDWAANMAMPDENYLMIATYDGHILAYPDEEIVGRNIFDDNSGSPADQKILAAMIRGAKDKGKDFIRYTVPAESGATGERIAYYRSIPAWRWLVVTWVNFDDLERVMAERQDLLTRNVQSQMLRIVIISVSMLALIMLLSKVLSRLANRSFSAFFNFFENAATSSTQMNPDEQPFEEFARLALAANNMISQRIEMEKEKLALQEKLSRSTKMEAMGLMAAEVAHDLNNILSGIIGYPQLLLLDENITGKQREVLGEILETGKRAAAVVSDLLTIARGVASIKLSLPVNSIVTAYANSPECRKLKEIFPFVELDLELSSEAGNIMASQIHLVKVVMNLVSNAFEAMPPDRTEARVTIQTELVEQRNAFSTSDGEKLEPGRYARITVKDNGPGIPPEDLNKIFEPFYSNKIKGRSGTGLGLAIVWNTIKDHGGCLDLQSGPGGAAFSIYIKSTEEKTAAVGLRKNWEKYKGAGQRILLVDDVDIQRKLGAMMLKTLGYEPIALSSGEAAIDFLKKEDVPLIILDMIMHPGLSGRETFEAIMKFKPDQKAIIASGMAETEEVARIQAMGAGQFVGKPYTIEDLAVAVKKALE